jgi:hypothetical protein
MKRQPIDFQKLKAVLPRISDSVSNLQNESADSLCGPCPRCGGDDRFVVKFQADGSEKFWCRECRPQSGDIIDFHCWMSGLSVGNLARRYL